MNSTEESFEDKIAFNVIVKEVYSIRKGINLTEVDIQSDNYKNFYKEVTKKLKKAFKQLGVNFNYFKRDKSKQRNVIYDIPIIIGEVFKYFALAESKKGSHFSKIKAGNFNMVTYQETKKLIDGVVTALKDRFPNNEKLGNFENVRKQWYRDLEYKKTVEDVKATILNNFESLLEESFSQVCEQAPYTDIVSVSVNYKYNDEVIANAPAHKIQKRIERKLLPYQQLNYEERIKLVNLLDIYSKEAFSKFNFVLYEYLSNADYIENFEERFDISFIEKIIKQSEEKYKQNDCDVKSPKDNPISEADLANVEKFLSEYRNKS